MRTATYIVLALACGITVTAILLWPGLSNQKKVLVADSTAKAVCSAIATEISNGQVPGFETLDNAEEYDRFITTLAKKYNLDAPADVAKGRPLLDPWGRRYKIQIRNNGKNVEVVSAGPDGKLDSTDDIRAETPRK